MKHKRNMKVSLIFPVTLGIIGVMGGWDFRTILLRTILAWGVLFLIFTVIDLLND